MVSTPRNKLEQMGPGTTDHDGIYTDGAVNRLDALVMPSVKDRDLTTPPGGETNGDRYLVGASATGDWSGEDDSIAHYWDGWIFTAPVEGFRVWVEDEDLELLYDGSAWQLAPFERYYVGGFKNKLINGNFNVWQRGTTITAPSTGDYGPDRFRFVFVGSGVVDLLRSTSVPDGLSNYSLQIDVTTADASIAAGDVYAVGQPIEGFNALPFGFGTSDAQQLTLSFSVSSPKTGIHCVAFQNSAVDRSYVAEYTVNAVDTEEDKVITLTADTAGTWLTDTGVGLHVYWALAAGTDFHGAADTWNAAAQDFATSNQVNVMDSAANNFHIARVQLELGPAATAFEHTNISDEQARCDRHYQPFSEGISGVASASTTVNVTLTFNEPMRVDPTIILEDTTPIFRVGNANETGSGSTITTSHIDTRGARLTIDGFTGLTIGYGVVAENAGVTIISADAEF